MSLFNLARFNLKSSGSITPSNKAVVTFGNVGIDEAVAGIKILDVIIGAVNIENDTNPRIVRAGSDYRRRRHGTRDITVIVELPLNKDVYADNVRKLRAWAESDEPKALKLPAHKNDLIYASLTGFSEYSLKTWWLPIDLVFTAWDPYFENVNENTASIGSSFSIGGSGEPSCRIVHPITESITDPEWLFEDGKKIKLIGTFSSGEIEIDLDRLMVYHNGVSAMSKLTLTSRFPHITPGIWLVNGPTGGFFKWKERWA